MKNRGEKKRIIVLSHMYPNKTDPINGIFIHNQIKHLNKAGCDIKVISPVPYAPKFLWFNSKWRSYGQIPQFDIIDEVPVYYPRYINLPGTWFRKISYWSNYFGIKKKIDTLMKSFRPQLIHAHTATPSGYVGLMLSRKYKIPLVCSLRGSDINVYPYYDRLTMFFTKQVISASDRIVSVSSSLKTAAEQIAIPKKTIKVVYNGCDSEEFSINQQNRLIYRQKMNIDQREKVIIFVGEIKKNKGIFELIDAFNKLMPKYPELHSFIIGNGPEYSNIKSEISDNNLDTKVHLIGNQPHNEISKWLSASDIFVLPTHYEGLPNAVLEAMACSLPVVATRVGGIPEIIENGENGILIDNKDTNLLTDAIEFLLKNEETAKRIGNAGREKLEQKFSWQRNAQEMIRIYNEAIYG